MSKALEADIWDNFEKKLKEQIGCELTADEREFLFIDASLNAQGLAHYITKLHS